MKLAKHSPIVTKLFGILILGLVVLSSCVILITDPIKADYVDTETTVDSHIAWITIYDQDGYEIINWTSVNGDTVPNVNSQDKRVGYWSIGVYINESECAYFSYPYEAISQLWLRFENISGGLNWYVNQINIDSYLSSYHDYGTYDIVVLKTPDWSEQMTYDWWRLDNELIVNSSLYVNVGDKTVFSSSHEEYYYPNIANGTVHFVRAQNTSLIGARAMYDYNAINVGSVVYELSSSTYYIHRQYAWIDNQFNFTESDSLVLGWTPWNPDGDNNYISCIVYGSPVNDITWRDDYWNLANFNSTPIELIPYNELSTNFNVNIPYSSVYGDYILVCFLVEADFEGLGVTSGSNYASITDMQGFYVITIIDDIRLSNTFIGSIINHENFAMDTNSIVWLLVGLLPAVVLGWFIGRMGVIVGLAIMAIVIGVSQSNYYWVTALTLAICGIMLYRGSD